MYFSDGDTDDLKYICIWFFHSIFFAGEKKWERTRVFLFKDSLQDEEELTKQIGEKQKNLGSNEKNRDGERLKDFYEECVEMSTALEQGPNKHNWFKANSE